MATSGPSGKLAEEDVVEKTGTSRVERYRQYEPKTTPRAEDAPVMRVLLPYRVSTEEDILRASVEDRGEENARPIACACIGCPHEANCQCICPFCHGLWEETRDGMGH